MAVDLPTVFGVDRIELTLGPIGFTRGFSAYIEALLEQSIHDMIDLLGRQLDDDSATADG